MNTNTRYQTFNGEGLEQGMYTLAEAHKKWATVEFDADTRTISVDDPHVGLRNDRADARGSNELATYVVYGKRYRADGWSDRQPLFRVWAAGDQNAMDEAQRCARRGTGGLATHGCESVESVECE